MKENQMFESSNGEFFFSEASVYFNTYILFICLQELNKTYFSPFLLKEPQSEKQGGRIRLMGYIVFLLHKQEIDID